MHLAALQVESGYPRGMYWLRRPRSISRGGLDNSQTWATVYCVGSGKRRYTCALHHSDQSSNELYLPPNPKAELQEILAGNSSPEQVVSSRINAKMTLAYVCVCVYVWSLEFRFSARCFAHCQAAPSRSEHKARTPPPDLPSLLLDSRIIYLGN